MFINSKSSNIVRVIYRIPFIIITVEKWKTCSFTTVFISSHIQERDAALRQQEQLQHELKNQQEQVRNQQHSMESCQQQLRQQHAKVMELEAALKQRELSIQAGQNEFKGFKVSTLLLFTDQRSDLDLKSAQSFYRILAF